MRPPGVALAALVTLLAGVVTSALSQHGPQYGQMVPLSSGASNGPLKVHLVDGKSAALPLEATRLMPGDQVARRYRVDGPEGLPFDLSVRTAHVRDAENGCTPAEAQVDISCGTSDGGELSSVAQLSVFVMLVAQKDECRFTGPVSPLSGGNIGAFGSAVHLGTVPVHEDACVEVRLDLPAAAGNETQSDSVTFDLYWQAEAMHREGRGQP